ncbi:RNA polymerase sigma factor [Spirillospora sp. NPDC127200]
MSDPDHMSRFTAVYDAHYDRVYAYAVSRAGRQLAEEVASETFCVAWRRVHDLPDEPLPWLLGVARNVLRESYRTRRREESLAAELRAWASPAELASGDVGEAVVERADMLRALAGLSEDDRELLTLTAWHGLSAGEAAKVVGCSKATFFVRLHRARRRLAQALSAPPAARPSVPTQEVC